MMTGFTGFKSSIQSTPVQRSTPAANASNFALERVDPIEIRAVIAYPSLVEPDANAGGKYGALFLITEVDDQTALIE
ncbi:MAG: hypothetical protein EBS61_09860, partial [Betaproteobacteria bacterium]|nr:hypothetical protein [Betaproteobacteria bacterium]